MRRRVVEARVEARRLSIIFRRKNTFKVWEDASIVFAVDIGNKKCDCGD